MKPIGGFFELELNFGEEFYKDAIRLNTGRGALEYILRGKKIKKVYLPLFICDSLIEPIKKLNIEMEQYSIDENFFPKFNFKRVSENEVFIYVNYFGICDQQVRKVAASTKNLVIDNSQAFFSRRLENVDTFYSVRKFFGVPDGAYLYVDKKLNEKLERENGLSRVKHLIGRLEEGPGKYYEEYKRNEKSFIRSSVKSMSKLTLKLLKNIDYERVIKKRIKNFSFLHKELGKSNEIKISLSLNSVPMVYPFLLDKKTLKEFLIKNKIFIPTYWPNVNDSDSTGSFEYNLFERLVALPIDQRYGFDEMSYIINVINQHEE